MALQPQTPGAHPAPAPLSSWERGRRLMLAEWHLAEAVAMAAVGEHEKADGHLRGAREYLELARGARLENRDLCADVLRFELEKEKEV